MDPSVVAARNAATAAQGSADQYASKSFTIGDELKKAVQEALDYNKDVIGYRSTALSDYLKSPADAASRFGTQTFEQGDQAGQANPNFIWNPNERNKAINDFISNQEVPFMNWNAILGMREGTIADTVNAGTNAFKAAAAAAQSKAAQAGTNYTSILNEFLKMQELAQGNRSLDIQEMSARKSGSGGGLSAKDTQAMQQAKLMAIGQIRSGMQPDKNGNIQIKTKDDITNSIYNFGFDPNEPDFQSLYGMLPAPKVPVSIGQRLAPVTDFFKNTGSAIMDYLKSPSSGSYPYLTPGMLNNVAPRVKA